jgi:hypothetical protein
MEDIFETVEDENISFSELITYENPSRVILEQAYTIRKGVLKSTLFLDYASVVYEGLDLSMLDPNGNQTLVYYPNASKRPLRNKFLPYDTNRKTFYFGKYANNYDLYIHYACTRDGNCCTNQQAVHDQIRDYIIRESFLG